MNAIEAFRQAQQQKRKLVDGAEVSSSASNDSASSPPSSTATNLSSNSDAPVSSTPSGGLPAPIGASNAARRRFAAGENLRERSLAMYRSITNMLGFVKQDRPITRLTVQEAEAAAIDFAYREIQAVGAVTEEDAKFIRSAVSNLLKSKTKMEAVFDTKDESNATSSSTSSAVPPMLSSQPSSSTSPPSPPSPRSPRSPRSISPEHNKNPAPASPSPAPIVSPRRGSDVSLQRARSAELPLHYAPRSASRDPIPSLGNSITRSVSPPSSSSSSPSVSPSASFSTPSAMDVVLPPPMLRSGSGGLMVPATSAASAAPSSTYLALATANSSAERSPSPSPRDSNASAETMVMLTKLKGLIQRDLLPLKTLKLQKQQLDQKPKEKRSHGSAPDIFARLRNSSTPDTMWFSGSSSVPSLSSPPPASVASGPDDVLSDTSSVTSDGEEEISNLVLWDSNASLRFEMSAAQHQGLRKSMEDQMVCLNHFNILFNSSPSSAPLAFYAVYDGHSGKAAAEYACTHLHAICARNESFQSGNICRALEEAYLSTDQRFKEKANREEIGSGTTAVTLFISQDKIYIANVGDSEAVLCREGVAELLSCAHVPSLEEEKERIIRAGGTVVWYGTWRVNGLLGVSRSIGDYKLEGVVIANPTTKEESRAATDDFLILASDGLWGVIRPQEACNIVCEYLRGDRFRKSENDAKKWVGGAEGEDEEDILLSRKKSCAAMLIEEAIKRKTTDNVTVIILFLDSLLSLQSAKSALEKAALHAPDPMSIDTSTSAPSSSSSPSSPPADSSSYNFGHSLPSLPTLDTLNPKS